MTGRAPWRDSPRQKSASKTWTVKKIAPDDCVSPDFVPQKQKRRAPCHARRNTPLTKLHSNFSVISGNCSFAFASDFTTKPSADSGVVLRAVAISLKI